MRIGEVLKLRPQDIQDRKLIIQNPKSGKSDEVVYIPRKLFERLRQYVRENNIHSFESIFSRILCLRMVNGQKGRRIGGYQAQAT